MEGFNFFQPSKGWSSGPTALWLASQQQYTTIYILGFDYQGTDGGKHLITYMLILITINVVAILQRITVIGYVKLKMLLKKTLITVHKGYSS